MILITAATGKTGAATANALLARGVKFRALVRNAEKATALKTAGVDLVVGDMADPAVVEQALKGIDTALLTLGNSQQQLAQERQFTDVAKRVGLKHLVKMSSMEAGPEARSPIAQAHYAAEQYIEQSGVPYTFMKPNYFMQNFLANAATIKTQDKFFLPMGDGSTATIDARDIGVVTAAVLTGTGHAGKRYELTGPEVLSFHAAAERISTALGRKITYVHVPMPAYRETLARFLTNEWHLNAVVALFSELAAATGHYTTDNVRLLTGKAPCSLETFVRDHKAVFTA